MGDSMRTEGSQDGGTAMDMDGGAQEAKGGSAAVKAEPMTLRKREVHDDGRGAIEKLGLDVNGTLAQYLLSAPLPDVKDMEDTKDPDGLCSRPFVDSRHTFLEMCQWRHYQFDTLRRAKHA